MLELLTGMSYNPGYGLGFNDFYKFAAPNAFKGLQGLLAGGMPGAPAPATAPMPAAPAPAAPPAMLSPVTPQSPYAGLLGGQAGQGGYGGMLSQMMSSPNRMMARSR